MVFILFGLNIFMNSNNIRFKNVICQSFIFAIVGMVILLTGCASPANVRTDINSSSEATLKKIRSSATAIYTNEKEDFRNRAAALVLLLDTFDAGTYESVINQYVKFPYLHMRTRLDPPEYGEFYQLHVTSPDGTECFIDIHGNRVDGPRPLSSKVILEHFRESAVDFYTDQERTMGERVVAFNLLVDTFHSGDSLATIGKYVKTSHFNQNADGESACHNNSYILCLIAPDDTSRSIQIVRGYVH
jgi:hypothetical protein